MIWDMMNLKVCFLGFVSFVKIMYARLQGNNDMEIANPVGRGDTERGHRKTP